MTLTTKHAIKVADILYPKGTEVELLTPEDEMVQAAFPGIKGRNDSFFVAVNFPDRSHATICCLSNFMSVIPNGEGAACKPV